MPKGGARTRSGPLPKERSARSDKRGYRLEALPAEGFRGTPPAYPLPNACARELEVWVQLWRTPQACAWSMPSELWRIPTIGLYVRQLVKCEGHDVGAAHIAQLHRLADQVGMTTTGLAAMGWKVEVEDAPVEQRPTTSGSKRRLRSVVDESALERGQRRAEGA